MNDRGAVEGLGGASVPGHLEQQLEVHRFLKTKKTATKCSKAIGSKLTQLEYSVLVRMLSSKLDCWDTNVKVVQEKGITIFFQKRFNPEGSWLTFLVPSGSSG